MKEKQYSFDYGKMVEIRNEMLRSKNPIDLGRESRGELPVT